jgi:hypothetical protein
MERSNKNHNNHSFGGSSVRKADNGRKFHRRKISEVSDEEFPQEIGMDIEKFTSWVNGQGNL